VIAEANFHRSPGRYRSKPKINRNRSDKNNLTFYDIAVYTPYDILWRCPANGRILLVNHLKQMQRKTGQEMGASRR
jgi:hypothetical protein